MVKRGGVVCLWLKVVCFLKFCLVIVWCDCFFGFLCGLTVIFLFLLGKRRDCKSKMMLCWCLLLLFMNVFCVCVCVCVCVFIFG